MQDMRALVDFGVRTAGSPAEARAAEWAADRLRAAGAAKVKTRTFRLTNGKTSRNVIGTFPGDTDKTIVIGAHIDSKPPSPGANDNGTGCGAVLEIARCLGRAPAYPTVVVVLFGSEEIIDGDPDHHHFGSRHYVASMSKLEREATAGMVSVDMIGYGPDFVVRTMGRGPQTMRYLLLAEAKRQGMAASYLADPGESGWSDHEAFELAGIPAAWVEWRDDPVYHTTGDTPGHVSAAKVRAAGQLVLSMLYGLDERGLRKLAR
jgi:Zn-dependent M28 family amino/carboxypeptidase